MSRAPRILPLIAIAIGGVLAMKAVGAFEAAPDFLKSAKARAEAAASGEKPKKGKAAASGKPAAPDAASSTPASSAAPPPPPGISAPSGQPELIKASTAAPICAPTAAELAKEAGLSPAELKVLQSLQARRGQLDQREQALQTELALLAAAEAKVDSKLKSLNDLKAQVTALMGQADQKQQTEVDRLVKVYSAMKPKEAALIMVQLDDKVRVPVAASMKERTLAPILAQMPPAEAKKLTEKLAGRFTPASSVTDAAEDQPAQATQPAAPKGRKPVKSGG
jgi:flagellar motility protein MotE (MotC chaperone)